MSTNPILSTKALTRRFGMFLAVDDLTLSVEPGEVLALLGRNGAGKSTAIKMLATLLAPTSGTAQVGGFDIVREPDAVRRIIGYVPQALSADGDLTGYENLLVFARLYDIPRGVRSARISEALKFMELEGFANKLVKTYSGGMIRRLEIAQSTLHQPQVLFLDEPTVGLDPVARVAVWNRIEELCRDFKSTILLTTHYLDEVARLCHRVAIMSRGRLAAIGTIGELTASIGANKTFDDAFEYYTRDDTDTRGSYDAASETRRTSERLG